MRLRIVPIDWSDGGVRDNVMKVMAGLMDAPVRRASERRVREKGVTPVLPWR